MESVCVCVIEFKEGFSMRGQLKRGGEGGGEGWELVVVREDTKAWWDILVCLSVGFLSKSDSALCVCVCVCVCVWGGV